MNNITYAKFPKDIAYIDLKEYYSEKNMVNLPLLGTVAAGAPILAEQQVDNYYTVPKTLIKNERDGFILKVKGDSMIDAHIQEGDLLICRIAQTAQNGDIVVATLDK